MGRFLILAALAAPCLGKDCWEWTTLDVEGPGIAAYQWCQYDAERGALVFWGGRDLKTDRKFVGSLEWDGATWTKSEREPDWNPAECFIGWDGCSTAIDPNTGIGVAIYGDQTDCAENREGEHARCVDGKYQTVWGPPCASRNGSATCYFPPRGQFITYGGQRFDWPTDVWFYDGDETWTNEQTPGGAGMMGHAIGYLPSADHLVAFGGFDESGQPNAQTRILTRYECPGPGDVNCDLETDFDDIDPFVLCITNGQKYDDHYPDCDRTLADVNADGYVDFADIDPFVELLLR